MHLTELVLNKITFHVKTRLLLALALNVSEQSIIKYLLDNKEDGPLTKASAIKVINEVTGLTQDQILTESKAKATA